MVMYNYIFVGLLLLGAVVFALLPVLVVRIIAPRKRSLAKGDVYECGVRTYGETWIRFRIQYYIYALMFVVFDIESLFLFPWAVSYCRPGSLRALGDGRLPGDPASRPGLCLGQGGLALGLSVADTTGGDRSGFIRRPTGETSSGGLRDELVGSADPRPELAQVELGGLFGPTFWRWAAWLVLGFFGIFPGIVAYMVWLERKVAARFQDRIGPNRVGPFGLLQPIADAIKLLTKEDIVPRSADQVVHLVAPVLVIVSAFLVHGGHPVRHQHGSR